MIFIFFIEQWSLNCVGSDPGSDYRFVYHKYKEETKERQGEENANFEDDSFDDYFAFPKAGTGDE